MCLSAKTIQLAHRVLCPLLTGVAHRFLFSCGGEGRGGGEGSAAQRGADLDGRGPGHPRQTYQEVSRRNLRQVLRTIAINRCTNTTIKVM